MVKTIKIRGKRFSVKNVPAIRGQCDHPRSTNKTINIPVDGDTLGELVVIIHELLHAAFWDIDEEVIDDVGHDIGVALWKLKWRKDT